MKTLCEGPEGGPPELRTPEEENTRGMQTKRTMTQAGGAVLWPSLPPDGGPR